MTAECIDFAGMRGDVHKARLGRSPLLPTPKCDDLPPSPPAGKFVAWLVAIVDPGAERRARAWLWHRARAWTWLPSAPVYRPRGARRTKVAMPEPMTNGYLLVPSLYIDHAAVLIAPGIHSYLRRGEQLIVVPDAAFDVLRREEENLNKLAGINPVTKKAYKPGDLVNIGNRIVSDVIAKIERVDESGRACLSAGSVRITTSIDKLNPI